MRRRFVGWLVLTGFLASLQVNAGTSPDDYGDEFGTDISLSLESYSKAKFKSSNETISARSATLSIYHSMPIGDEDALSFGFDAQGVDLDTHALLPGTNTRIPNEVSGSSFSIGWDHALANDMSLSIWGEVGSFGDKPYEGSNANYYSLSTVLAVPSGNYDAWWLGAELIDNYGDKGAVPVIAYEWNPSDTFQALIGIPYLELYWQAHERVEIHFGGGESGGGLRGEFFLSDETALFASYSVNGWEARRFARSDNKALLTYQQNILALGVARNFGPVDISFGIGRATDGRISEERQDAGNPARLRIEDSDFVLFTIGTAF